MNKSLQYIISVSIIFLVIQTSFAQSNLNRILRDPSGAGYSYLEFVSDSEGWIVTEDVIKKTYDSGKTWEVKLTIDRNLYDGYYMPTSVDFVNGNVGYFAISTVIDYSDWSWQKWLFKTTDGGDSWSRMFFSGEGIEVQSDFGKLHFFDENYGWCYYKSSKIIGTTNGGETWNILSDSPGTVYKTKFVSNKIGYLLTGNGLYKTTDGGINWEKISIDGVNYFWAFSAIGNKVWVGSDGVYYSEDSGNIWSKISSDVVFGNTSSLSMIDEYHGMAYDNGSSGYWTSDGGTTWTLKSDKIGLFAAFDYNNVWYFSNRNFYKATDNFNNVDLVLPDMEFSDVVMVNDQVILASAFNGAIIKSVDGGKTWTFINDLYGAYVVNDLCFGDAGNGIAVGYYDVPDDQYNNGFIALTTDLGESWNIVMDETGEAFGSEIYSADYSNGRFTTKSIGKILWSDDNGNTWSIDSTDFYASFSQMDMISDVGFGIPFYGNQKLVKTTNGGVGWTNTAESNANSVYFVADNLLWANFGWGKNFKSDDYGATWVDAELDFNDIYFKNSLLGLAHGYLENGDISTEGVYITQDGGSSWDKIESKIISFTQHAIDFVSAEKGFFANQRDLYTTLSFGSVNTLVSVEEEHNEKLAQSFKLNQNYPNPFNPSTKITYSIPKASDVKLVVFDALGRELKILVNQAQNTGSYSINFNAEDLSSGIYFYRISAGNFTQTNKMILIK